MSDHRWLIPKKRLSTHTMIFKWHHRNLSKMTMSHWKRIMNEDTHGLFRFFNTKNAKKYQKFLSDNRGKTWSVQLFLPGPWRFFAGALPPWGHQSLMNGPANAPWFMSWLRRYINCLFVCLLSFLPHLLYSSLSSFLVLSLLLIYFLTRLLPDLNIYSFQNRPVPFPGRRPNLL